MSSEMHKSPAGEPVTHRADRLDETVLEPLSSVSRPVLTRSEYRGRYRELLDRHLSGPLADFFSNTDRLLTLAQCLGTYLVGENKRVLNVGCGPFAAEIFVSALQRHTIHSVDYTSEFEVFFDIFRQEGLLANAVFTRADIREMSIDSDSFDLVILHDILYEPEIDLIAMLDKVRTVLSPGGLLYLDFMNIRVRWLWKLLGREREYQRYDPDELTCTLDRYGFDILHAGPVHKSGWGTAGLFHAALWAVCRTSNSIGVMAIKRPTGSPATRLV